jgi:hypothetical protein
MNSNISFFINKYSGLIIAIILFMLIFLFTMMDMSNQKDMFYGKVSYELYDNFDFHVVLFLSFSVISVLMLIVYFFVNRNDVNVISNTTSMVWICSLILTIILLLTVKSVDSMYYSIYNHHLENFLFNFYYGDSQNYTIS